MLLITETNHDVNLITEGAEGGSKNYFIEGIFMQSEKQNCNGRVYPKKILSAEVDRYNKEFVKSNRAMGELGHPEGPTVNLERVSHIIKELSLEGNDVAGKANILDTPYGKIVRILLMRELRSVSLLEAWVLSRVSMESTRYRTTSCFPQLILLQTPLHQMLSLRV